MFNVICLLALDGKVLQEIFWAIHSILGETYKIKVFLEIE